VAALAAIATALPEAQASAANPPENIPLGTRPASCANEASVECEQWVITRLDAARAQLDLHSYELPEGFVAMAPDHQLLILADLDRVAYGLTPIYGLNRALTEAAQAGVREGTDPRPPTKEGPWRGFGSDWASTGTLIAYYLWMYDDGYKGPNEDCTSPTASGCWGHRRVILGEGLALPQPELLGAATATSSSESGTALIVSSDSSSSSYYTWAQAQSEGAGRETGGTHQPVTIRVQISGSGTVSVGGASCSSTCSQSEPYGTAVKLVAKPAAGSRFTGWGAGACSGSRRTCTLPATAEEEVARATFGPRPKKASAALLARLGGGLQPFTFL
jgi:hypothetical protein